MNKKLQEGSTYSDKEETDEDYEEESRGDLGLLEELSIVDTESICHDIELSGVSISMRNNYNEVHQSRVRARSGIVELKSTVTSLKLKGLEWKQLADREFAVLQTLCYVIDYVCSVNDPGSSNQSAASWKASTHKLPANRYLAIDELASEAIENLRILMINAGIAKGILEEADTLLEDLSLDSVSLGDSVEVSAVALEKTSESVKKFTKEQETIIASTNEMDSVVKHQSYCVSDNPLFGYEQESYEEE